MYISTAEIRIFEKQLCNSKLMHRKQHYCKTKATCRAPSAVVFAINTSQKQEFSNKRQYFFALNLSKLNKMFNFALWSIVSAVETITFEKHIFLLHKQTVKITSHPIFSCLPHPPPQYLLNPDKFASSAHSHALILH